MTQRVNWIKLTQIKVQKNRLHMVKHVFGRFLPKFFLCAQKPSAKSLWVTIKRISWKFSTSCFRPWEIVNSRLLMLYINLSINYSFSLLSVWKVWTDRNFEENQMCLWVVMLSSVKWKTFTSNPNKQRINMAFTRLWNIMHFNNISINN